MSAALKIAPVVQIVNLSPEQIGEAIREWVARHGESSKPAANDEREAPSGAYHIPTRLDVIAETASKPGGATIDEIARAVALAFPTSRHGRLAKRTTLRYARAYAARALDHMNTGRVGRGAWIGKIKRDGDRYTIAT